MKVLGNESSLVKVYGYLNVILRSLQNRRISGAVSETRYTSEERYHTHEARDENIVYRISDRCLGQFWRYFWPENEPFEN